MEELANNVLTIFGGMACSAVIAITIIVWLWGMYVSNSSQEDKGNRDLPPADL